MSEIAGLAHLRSTLSAFDRMVQEGVAAGLEAEVRAMQADAVGLVPRRTGKLAEILARDDAIARKGGGADVEYRFGFVSKDGQREGYYALWVEFGTKGYRAGSSRFAGRNRQGRVRFRKVEVDVPARPAQPFIRPAFERLKARVQVLRLKANAFAAVRSA